MARRMTTGAASIEPMPLYEQVKRYVADQISSGFWRVGERVPSENALAAELAMSRLTVHRALRELTSAGVLQRLHGVGTFVAPPSTASPMVRIHNIADEIRGRGQTFGASVHALKAVQAGDHIAAQMVVRPGARLFHSLIVYQADDVPVQLEDRCVLPAFAPQFLKQDFHAKSTTDYLQSIALATEAEHVIEAMMPDPEMRELLRIGANEPCLTITRKTWVKGRVTTYTRFIHPGSRHKIWSRITAWHRD